MRSWNMKPMLIAALEQIQGCAIAIVHELRALLSLGEASTPPTPGVLRSARLRAARGCPQPVPAVVRVD